MAGCKVVVPSATDRIAMALGHGGLSSFANSDWMLDIVETLRNDKIDWDLLVNLIERRRQTATAAVSLSYLASRRGCPMDASALTYLQRRSTHHPTRLVSGLLLAAPKKQLASLATPARSATKAWVFRSRRSYRSRSRPVRLARRSRGFAKTELTNRPEVFTESIEIPDSSSAFVRCIVEGSIQVTKPACRRRLEFELNVDGRHLVRLHYRKWTTKPIEYIFYFRIPIVLHRDEDRLRLESVPSRAVRTNASNEFSARYASLPFKMIARCSMESVSSS